MAGQTYPELVDLWVVAREMAGASNPALATLRPQLNVLLQAYAAAWKRPEGSRS
jgi:hypothetical protein